MKPRAHGGASLLAVLFGRMGVLFLVMVLAAGSIAFVTAQRRIDDIYDGQLIIGANVLRALMAEELREEPPGATDETELQVDDAALLSREDRAAFDNYANWRMFRIWRGHRVVLRSDTGPQLLAPPQADGFSEIAAPSGRWRIYTLHVRGKHVVVQVGERMDIRLVLVRGIAVGLVLPLLLLVPTAAALIWLSLRDGLGALRRLIAEIGLRTMRDLSPLPLEPWPRDLHPMVRSINLLFGRIDRAVRNERRFLDDAAHQLRTPLAAVKLQAQLIAGEESPAERRALTEQLVASVDRAADMTDRLLTLSRLEAWPEGGAGGDVREAAVSAIADLAALAARRGVELSFVGEGAFPGGDPVLLRLVASNLLENAINHAPAGSEILTQVSPTADGCEMRVIDAGPGIAPADRARVIERFHRGAHAAANGSGLGLAIVAEAVRILGGRLQLLDRPDGQPGLCALVTLPQRRL